MPAVSVFLADDSAIVREGVRAMLRRDTDVEVVGVAQDRNDLGQQLLAGVMAVLPAITIGAIGSVVAAIGLSALTPLGLARRL
jgi:DNA-binding NarL/FixJ family response regulator